MRSSVAHVRTTKHCLAPLGVAIVALFARMGPARAAENPVLTRCLVTLIEEAQVPAQEAGVITKMEVREGVQVKRNQMLAQVDDMQVRLQKKAAEMEEKAARQKATSDVDERFARAAAGVAKLEYERALQANRRTPGALAEVEVNRLKLAWQKAELQIEQAQNDRVIQGFTADNKAAEVEAAENNISRRQLLAPLDGIVVQVNGHLGEWVKPGDSLIRVVRVDRLRVEGYLSGEKYNPDEISGRSVTVDVILARGQRLRFPGRVTFVSPLDEAGGNYRVYADVENRQGENQQWLLRPGLQTDMTIVLK